MRENVLDDRWREIGVIPAEWNVALDLLQEDGLESTVLVAGRRADDFDELVDGIQRLRAAGIAEPTST
jgi:hypothetical protein